MKQQQAYIGISAIKALRNELERLSIKNVLLIRGKNAYELCGAKTVMDSIFQQLNINVTEFYDFSENPKIEDVERGLSVLSCFEPDIIIGIGGGSVLDMAKLIRFFYSYKGDIAETEYIQHNTVIPLIAVPTTAGTGSEATHFAVVYKDKVKYSVAHPDILADVAVVYPPFTYSAPKYLAACTGFDALAQSIEAWWNVNATEESDEYAIKAITLLWKNLPLAVNKQLLESKEKISEGAYWAGRAINITKTTAPHAMSYAFTTYYGIPHGHAVALTFPYFFVKNIFSKNIVTNTNTYRLKINKLLQTIDCENNEFSTLNTIQQYIFDLELHFPHKIIDFKKIINEINMQRMKNNPVPITEELKSELYKYLTNNTLLKQTSHWDT